MTDKRQLALEAIYEYSIQIQTLDLATGDMDIVKPAEGEMAEFCHPLHSMYEYVLAENSPEGVTEEAVAFAKRETTHILKHMRLRIAAGRRSSQKRVRCEVDGVVRWMNILMHVPRAYAEETPLVILFWTPAEYATNTYEDALQMLERSFCHVAKVNLTEDQFDNIQCDDDETKFLGFHYTTAIHRMVDEGFIVLEDVEKFSQTMNVEHLREHFHQSKEGVFLSVQRKIHGEYRWVSLEIFPSRDYLEENQIVIIFVRDIHEQQQRYLDRQRQMEYFAYVDSLSGCANRAGYNQLCENYTQQMAPHTVGVIFSDINGLKYVNDTYGHKKGDEYLCLYASKVMEFYGRDHCFRISGDEFVIVLEHLTKEHFVEETGKLADFLSEQPSPMAAVGIAWVDSPRGIEEVERVAEQRMYQDKRDYYKRFFGIESDERVSDEGISVDVEEILREHHAIEENSEVFIDKSGLSNRVFDVFSATSKRGYLFLCNRQTNVSRWSQKALRDFDMPGEYIKDAETHWAKNIHPDDREGYWDGVHAVLEGKVDELNLTYRAKTKKGDYVICSCECAMIHGEGDEPDYFAGTIINYGIADDVDNTTHLATKSAFLRRLEELAVEERSKMVMMVMLDSFSSLNILYGFRFGDEVLRTFAAQLQNMIGTTGEVYHLDGASFGICIYDMDEEGAKELYEQIRAMAHRNRNICGRHIVLHTIASATVFGYAGAAADRIASNLGFAIDISRTARHGDVVFYDRERHVHEFGHRTAIGAIYQSILTDFRGFFLCYQPIVSAATGKIIGAEALVRWQNEKYGFMPPDAFIPFIERNACVYEMGKWVIRQALRDAAQTSTFIPDFIININIAAPQLERKEFRQDVLDALAECVYPPERLCLELTERCRELDMAFLREEIEFFRAQGIRIAMDDFGTGNASLQLVLELPLDEVKIDRKFVRDIQEKEINQVLVATIVGGARAIHADICIEGIEDSLLEEYLRRYRPTYYQGYLYSKPVPKEDFLALISHSESYIIRRRVREGARVRTEDSV